MTAPFEDHRLELEWSILCDFSHAAHKLGVVALKCINETQYFAFSQLTHVKRREFVNKNHNNTIGNGRFSILKAWIGNDFA